MAEIHSKIIGETDGISEIQLKFVLDVLREYGNDDVLFEDIGKKGDNYLATVKRITKNVQDDEKKIKVISKFAPTVAIVREEIETASAFKNETIMYKEVFPKFQELQEKFKIPKDYTFKFAKCFGASEDAPNEVILLEDLREQDYVVLNKFEALSNSTIKVLLKSFAVYNALSYAYKKYDPLSYENVKKSFTKLFNKEEIPNDFIISTEKVIQGLVDTRDNKHYMNGILTGMYSTNNILLSEDQDSPRSIIQHGDAWTNNFLFKLQDKEPISCILIDFQASKVGSTAMDLLFMFLTCSDHKSRLDNFHAWIDYYYSELDTCLGHFGLSAAQECPRDLLDNDFKRYGKIALGVAMMITFFTNRDASEVQNIKDGSVSVEDAMSSMTIGLSENTLNKLRAKYQGMYDTCVHFGLLDYWKKMED